MGAELDLPDVPADVLDEATHITLETLNPTGFYPASVQIAVFN